MKIRLRAFGRGTQIVARLLARRAYQVGENGREEISTDAYRFLQEGGCFDGNCATACDLLPSLLAMLGPSYNLYRRVQLLDQHFIAH
tara:strand:- start:1224 stop:1484 length:261 start_codon:yes stop_codon:yes gene_type:complete